MGRPKEPWRRGNDKAAEAWVNTKQWYMAAGLASLGLWAAACGSDKKHGDGAGDGNGDGSGDAGVLRDGRVVEPDVCGKHLVKSDHAVPDMLIVLDKSGSMAPSGNATRTDRWKGSRDAVDEVTAMYDSTINFGLMTFPASGGGFGGSMTRQCAAGTVDVDIGPSTGAMIRQALAPMNAAGYTPTAATLHAALDVIGTPASADQSVTSPKFILLVTDGDPNCSKDYSVGGGFGGVAPPDPIARMETLDAINKLTLAGVKTYVVGYQTAATDFASVLDMMAAAGGTGQTKHQSVNSGDELSMAFESLAGMAASCSYHLTTPVQANFVLVTVAGKTRAFNNTADGWTLSSDRKTVSLTGAACDAAQKGGVFTVEVQCEEVIGI
ncbi:MAG: CglB [Myxococcaceae bacterium]|nr:CglB [Myxococcaceae bacterium]